MAWETRDIDRTYYYRKRRLPDGRVVSQYAGPAAARADRQRRQFHQAQDEIRSLESAVDAWLRLANGLRDAVLLTAGFHQHKGQWRKAAHHGP